MQRAAAENREHTSADYFRQLDGLRYEDIVKLTDPTGLKDARYRKQYRDARGTGSTLNDAAAEVVQRAIQNGERIPSF